MNAPLRRGACPGLSAPMRTGDGLLVRMLPAGTIALAAFAKLCASARLHGSGVMEITARGSIQVRGLTIASAPRFAAAIGALGIAAENGIPIHTAPLAGLDPGEWLDAQKLAADLRRALSQRPPAAWLSPKVSVAVDGGGALGLDDLAADVRLRAELLDGGLVLEVGAGGDRAGATKIGIVAPEHGVAAVVRLLDVIAPRGRDARARDILAAEGDAPFRSAISDVILPSGLSIGHDAKTRRDEIVGAHRLADGSFAFGLALAFGHVRASSLEDLLAAAGTAGASGLRTAPNRTLIAIGMGEEKLTGFAAVAERTGFITRADDPRRGVIACAGAPFCASGYIAARAIAPGIAKAAAHARGGAFSIHVSGCAKGCAHPAPAALTIVGTAEGCALVANGSARDAPFATVKTNELNAAIANHARERDREAAHV